ncbi:unnamed protein product [Closterium sp. Yama58-4]|nr:unnamed protein product [Closterium sp. Yama58-4]
MAGGRRNGRGGGKTGGKVNGTAGNSPLTSAERSPEKSPLVSAQASPLPKAAVSDVLGDAAKISLQERLSALKVNGLKDNEDDNETQHPQGSTSAGVSPSPATMASATATMAEGGSKYEDEDVCWDSDDEDDFDPSAVSLLASQVSFPLTLLIPIQWESEVPKLKPTVMAHLDHWKASLTADAQTTTNTLPKLTNVLVIGDLNVVEDPALDKSTGIGSSAENRRLMGFWANTPLTDAFRYAHPGKREYTFHMRSKGVSTRIDRALVSQPLLCKLVEVRHADITNKMTGHWSAVVVVLESSAAVDRGPGIWRLMAAQAKKRGADGVSAGVHKRGKKEGRGNKKALGKGDKDLQAAAVTEPELQADGSNSAQKEELLDAYERSHQEKLQEWLGVKAELDGEATTGFLSGKVKVRKAKTEMSAVTFKGKTHSGAREVLAAATDFFRDSFGGSAETSNSEPRVMRRTLCEASRNALSAPWSEEEVRTAVRELAPGKSPGQDGLPKELFEHNWDLLGPVLMKFVGDFTRSAELPRDISTAVTILLHKTRSKEELGNYRPITLLSTVYKVLAKVMATRFKKVLHEVISEEQVGFLPGRKLADAVAVVADAIEAGATGGKDWFLLMVDFQKAFDSISRPFLFSTLRGMGVPEVFVSWAEGLHTGAGTRLHINGWTGDRVAVERGVRQGCPLAPYLFLCAVEPLCQEFEQRRLGVGDGGAERLAYLGYADDTSLLLHGEEQLAAAAEAL